MDSKTDWKIKYQNIINELEGKEKTWGNLESLLRKTIGRLTIAGQGIDKRLDAQLKDIQSLSRKKSDDKLAIALDQLSDVLTQIDESPTKGTIEVKDELSNAENVMSHLLDLLSPPEQFQSSFEKIRSHLPPKVTDSILNELANELNSIMSTSDHENGTTQSGQSIDDVILDLLDRLSIVPSMNKKTKSIQQDILNGISTAQWPSVLDHIAEEVSKALQLINDEKNELELFIAQVTTQLAEISGYITNDKKTKKTA
ncbi:MAG: hypothetical protein ISR69_12550 [Gammaproteobacteria bacterium]|nr:hypothetical protein [Gammaproteobacteria bacterium]